VEVDPKIMSREVARSVVRAHADPATAKSVSVYPILLHFFGGPVAVVT